MNEHTETLDGYMKDASGRLVPRDKVKPEHLLEDELVRSLHEKADARHEALLVLKEESFADIRTLQSLLAEKYDTKLGGQKGNLTLHSYDGLLRITVAIGDRITFGPELQVAKKLIDECLDEWTEEGNSNIRAIVADTFDVKKEGKLRVDNVLGLRRLNITEPKWLKAMEAIADAIRVESSKSYVRFHKKANPDAHFVQTPLDIARV
ncbi:DUF3164 family protein [Entomobacter blattae]|uniref:Sulfate transporter n=1 Tax=Entomobacter blattae TaxID=2762277 RepID=A0A7H1NUG6_9PROT|nr:DUF3164 family protein [Entomobacter blattae]QNT79426.1 hypothetical protein JGUZn3_22250 [Entomobacter blattae]